MKVRQILAMVLAVLFVAGCLDGCSSKATVGDAGANGNYAPDYEYGDAIYDKTEAPQESASILSSPPPRVNPTPSIPPAATIPTATSTMPANPKSPPMIKAAVIAISP